jgi:penicillin-binding protein 2
VIVKEPVGRDPVHYLKEHQNEFRGLGFQDSFLRHYPHGPLASQLLGYVSEVSKQELKQHPTGVVAGDKVGQAGIESAFDAYLRGAPGRTNLRVDSLGRPIGPVATRSVRSPAARSG